MKGLVNMFGIPMVVKHNKGGERAYDIFSRVLEDRIIFLADEITPESAAITIAQLLHLNSESNDDIALYVMSPGGHVDAGLAIIDTMNYIKSDVMTIGLGTCASMGALILSSGTKGKRIVLPDTRVMIHQVLGGASGQATEVEIHTKEILRLKKRTNEILAANTGKTLKTIEKDTDRDNFMSAEEAVKYGIVDGIIKSMNDVEKAAKAVSTTPSKSNTTKTKVKVKTTKK